MIKKMFEILCSNFSIGLVQLMPQNIIGFHLMIYINIGFLRIHWRLSTILKISKKVYELIFINMKKSVYSESVFNTQYI